MSCYTDLHGIDFRSLDSPPVDLFIAIQENFEQARSYLLSQAHPTRQIPLRDECGKNITK